MGGLYDFLADLKQRGQAAGQFLGLLNVLIGRRVQKEDGSPISSGVTWRELSFALKKVRWEKESVRDLGIDPARVAAARSAALLVCRHRPGPVDSARASAAGDRLAEVLRLSGYRVSPAPDNAPPKRS